MKMTEKDKPVKTMPQGVWESSNPAEEKGRPAPKAADAQGNGYPAEKQGK